ncbi:hypothetical protein WJX79_004282 [Trebouxia sp. C0005]
MPGDAVVEVVAKVRTVTNASASVDVILQNATSHKMIAKGRYTEQAPHTIRARASAYFNTAASKARSAVHRLQTAAEGALQRNGSVAANLSAAKVSEQTELQVAADNTLRSSSGDSQQAETNSADNNSDSTEAGDSPTTDIANQALLQRIAMVKDNYRGDDCSCFDTTVGCLLKDIKVDEGACSAVLPTSARLSDQQGHLHAGCYCSLVDLISTTALASADKRPAVTVTISVDFFAPLSIGEDLLVDSHMVKAGKTLTFAEVSFRQRSTGELIAQGSHVEYSAGGTPYPDTIEEYHDTRVARHTSKL